MIDLSKYKQFLPFAIVGAVAGVFALISKKNSGGGSSDSSTSSDTTEGLNDIKGIMKENQQATDQQFRDVSIATTQAFKEQKYYYDGVVKDLTDKFTENDKTLTGKIDELQKANQELSNDLSNALKNSGSGGSTNTQPSGNTTPPATNPVPLSKQQRDDLYKQTYDIVNQAMNSNNKYDYEAARYAVEKMKNAGIDEVTPGNSAVGEFSKQLDKVKDNNNFVRKYEPM